MKVLSGLLATPIRLRYSVLALVAVIAADGLWVLFASPKTSGVGGGTFPPYLSALLAATLVLSTIVLLVRWEPSGDRAAWFGSLTEWVAVAYGAGNVVGFVLDGLGTFGGTASDPSSWFLPAGLFGATLAVYSTCHLALPWGRAGWFGLGLIVLPVPFAILVFVPAAGGTGSSALVGVALIASAFLFEAGSVGLRAASAAKPSGMYLPRTPEVPRPTPARRPEVRATPTPGRPVPASPSSAQAVGPAAPPAPAGRPTPSPDSLLAFERALLSWQKDLESQRQELAERERLITARSRSVSEREVDLARKAIAPVPPPRAPSAPSTTPSPTPPASSPAAPPIPTAPSRYPVTPAPAPPPSAPIRGPPTALTSLPAPRPAPSPSVPSRSPPSEVTAGLSAVRNRPPEPARPPASPSLPAPPVPRPEPPKIAGPAPPSGEPGRGPLTRAVVGDAGPGSSVAIVADASATSRAVIDAFLLEGLRRDEHAIIVTMAEPGNQVSEELAAKDPRFLEYQREGVVLWVDGSAFGRAPSAAPSGSDSIQVDSPSYVAMLSRFLSNLRTADAFAGTPVRVGVLGIAVLLDRSDYRVAYAFLRNMVSLLRGRNAVALLQLEPDRPGRASIEPIVSRSDRAIVLRAEGDRVFARSTHPAADAVPDWFELPLVASHAGAGLRVPGH
jgi:hypothetical protein